MRGSVLGLLVSDRAGDQLIGSVSQSGSFNLRRARSLGTVPRVIVLRGRVQPTGASARVVAGYAFHPAVRAAGFAWAALVAMFTIVVVPGVRDHPELLWIPAVMGFTAVLFWLPVEWLARADRASLSASLGALLQRAGPVVGDPE